MLRATYGGGCLSLRCLVPLPLGLARGCFEKPEGGGSWGNRAFPETSSGLNELPFAVNNLITESRRKPILSFPSNPAFEGEKRLSSRFWQWHLGPAGLGCFFLKKTHLNEKKPQKLNEKTISEAEFVREASAWPPPPVTHATP